MADLLGSQVDRFASIQTHLNSPNWVIARCCEASSLRRFPFPDLNREEGDFSRAFWEMGVVGLAQKDQEGQGLSTLAYSRQLSSRQLKYFKLTAAGKVLQVGLRSGRLSSVIHTFECLVTSPFARQKVLGFYSLGQFYLRFVETDTEKLQLLVWLQDKAAGFVMFDQSALEALLSECTRQFAVEHAQLAVAFQSVRLHRPMERVLQALDQVMPRLALAS